MNEINELRQKYNKAINDARETYVKDVNELLERHDLNDKVIRKDDGKIGWLEVDFHLHLLFYPMKKDGTKSLNASGYFWENETLDRFEPYREGQDEGLD